MAPSRKPVTDVKRIVLPIRRPDLAPLLDIHDFLHHENIEKMAGKPLTAASISQSYLGSPSAATLKINQPNTALWNRLLVPKAP
jgi:hypothetical protein